MDSTDKPETAQPYVPMTSPREIVERLLREYGDNPRCPHCGKTLPPKNLWGVPIHHIGGIEQIVRHTIVIYEDEMRKAGVKHE